MTAAKPSVLWTPNPGPQTRFLSAAEREVLYGGAAGGGKSAGLVAMPLRWVDNPEFRCLVLRREIPQLVDLLNKARALYPKAFPGAREDIALHTWIFPSGATIWFTHCEGAEDYLRFQGHEYHLIAPDELTHFTEKQHQEIGSRCRGSGPGLPRFIRCTSNPGGPGHGWVFKRWGPWLDPKYPTSTLLPPRFAFDGKPLPPAAPGQTLWVYRPKEGKEEIVPPGTPEATTRTFIPAKVTDNPKLLENDPDYVQQLRDNDPVRRKQLEDGDWTATYTKGDLFQRSWFEVLSAAIAKGRRVRFWDRAATEEPKPGQKKDPDWTVGLRLHRTESGLLVVEHVERFRVDSGEIPARIKAIAEQDGKQVTIGLEQEPGGSGKFEAGYYVRFLAGYDVRVLPASTSKRSRATPVSSQARPPANNVKILQGAWNDAFLQELEEFPLGKHDDQVDALSGAFAVLFTTPRPLTKPTTPAVGDRRDFEGFA